jgi:YVTN family beta-propeller protein
MTMRDEHTAVADRPRTDAGRDGARRDVPDRSAPSGTGSAGAAARRRRARGAIIAASLGIPGVVLLATWNLGAGQGGHQHTTRHAGHEQHAVALHAVGAPMTRSVRGGRGKVRLAVAAETASAGSTIPAGAPLALTVALDHAARAATGPGVPRLSARRLPAPGVVGGAVPLGQPQTVLINRATGATGAPPAAGSHAGHAAPGLQATQSSTRGGALAWAATLPKGAADVRPSPDGRFIVAGYPATGRVALLDVFRRRLDGTIAIGGSPTTLRFAPDGRLWIGDPERGQVAIVDVDARRVDGRFAVGGGALALAFDPAGRRALVVSRDDGAARLVDTRTLRVLSSVSVGGQPTDVAFAPAAHAFLVARAARPLAVVRLDRSGGVVTARELAQVPPPVRAVRVAPDGRTAVALAGSKMVVLDTGTNRVRTEVAAGTRPADLAFLDRRFAVALDAAQPKLSWVDLQDPSRSNTIPLEAHPGRSLNVSPDGREALVAVPRDGWIFHVHVMMGRPMLMQQDRDPLGADTVVASRAGLVPTGRGRLAQRTLLEQPGRYRIAVRLPGGGRATFPLTVATPGAGIRVRPERRLVTARAGERVTVRFDVAGAAPARAEVLAYSASPTSVRQLRAVASRVGPGRYAATLRTVQPGRYVVSLLADTPALPAAGRASATLVVR